MNSYKFSDLSVGMAESFNVKITEEMIDKFIDLTGDIGLIHTDREYAISHGFSDRVCHGMLFGSLFSTLAGVYLPGEHCLLESIDLKFLNPVFPGNELTVSGEITELNDTFKICRIKGYIFNEKGEKVCRAFLQMGVRE